MTDRFHSLTVVLEHDIREDEALRLLDAIRCLRGVLSVNGEVADVDTHMAQERARRELGETLLKVIYPRARE